MLDSELLDLWARAGASAGGSRAAALAAALADLPATPDVPLGDLNRALLEGWRSEFGDRLECVAACPGCGARLEAEVSVGGLLAAAEDAGPAELDLGDRRVALRRPTLGDLEAAAAEGSPARARAELARRAVGPGVEVEGSLAAAVAAALDAADPHAAVRLSLRCPACGTSFVAVLDVGAHVWAAVDRRARLVMAEVAELAAVYGWSEDDVLRLPAARRRAYAEQAAR